MNTSTLAAKWNFSLIMFLASMFLASCGDGGADSPPSAPVTYSVGGTLDGLAEGSGISLLNNDTDIITLSANGHFTFPTTIAGGAPYKLSIGIPPDNQSCSLANEAGRVTSSSATVINVICTANNPLVPEVVVVTYPVGGTLKGLAAGNSITLVNGTDNLTLSANGPFTFPTAQKAGTVYNLSISKLPANQSCTQIYGSAKTTATSVSAINVICGIPPRGGMISAAKLGKARYVHTSTLLPSGKVLVTGGIGTNGALASVELYDPAAGTWSSTGKLSAARYVHTATLLSNGKVLVTGESGEGGAFASAELYDPLAGTWSKTGDHTAARLYHTATLLPNGKVLLTGGFGSNGILSSVELYDPVADTWSATGNLASARRDHTATLLPNGKVLVTGGFGVTSTLASAELYDPASGVWSATGNLATARRHHAATLLPNGKVLVSGGFGASGKVGVTYASVELYDPASGNWSATGMLGFARHRHTATLQPNGKVLVTGGFGAGGESGVTLTSAELYDSATGIWSSTGSLAVRRRDHTATLLHNGKVLVAGGFGADSTISALDSAELFDPTAGAWGAVGNLAVARYLHTATQLSNGKVLVTGGGGTATATKALASTELFDPTAGTWKVTGSPSASRREHTATLLPDGKVLVTGGGGAANTLASAELYDPANGVWKATGSLAAGRYLHTATLLPNGKLLAAGGGSAANTLASAELYDPATGIWRATGSLAEGRQLHTATLLPNGKVLVAGGGSAANAHASAELYDPATGTWKATGSLAAARRGHTATLLPNGKVLVTGGGGSAAHTLAGAELYDPASGTWKATGSLAAARRGHTATLLPNGKVLVAGGSGTENTLASAELYDPATGTWSTTGSAAAPRRDHATTLLSNGKVLVTGGFGTAALASAEYYW